MTRFIFTLEKGNSQTSKVAAKGFSGGKVSGEMSPPNMPSAVDKMPESNFLPIRIALDAAMRKHRLNPGRRRRVSEINAANVEHKQEIQTLDLFHFKPQCSTSGMGRENEKGGYDYF